MNDSALSPLLNRLRNARDWLRRDDHYILAEKTPFQVIAGDGLASLRYYPPLKQNHIHLQDTQLPVQRHQHQTPLVIVSPLAVNMRLYDLFPELSFVRYMLAQGFPVYLVDWGSPQREHDSLTLASYFAERLPRFLAKVREHSGSQVLSLHGWSFGALFSYAYTALKNDKNIRNLVLVGAPCDYHANGTLGYYYRRLSRYLNWLQDHTTLRVHKTRAAWWRSSGARNAISFKFTSPVASLKSYTKLLSKLDDSDYVMRHATNSAFLDRMEAYPGGTVQDMVQYLMMENVLARGRLPMKGTPAVIHNITANLLLVTGEQDTIVTEECSLALLNQVASKDVTSQKIPGGHMSIVGGPAAAEKSWPLISDWLAQRDTDEQVADRQKRHA